MKRSNRILSIIVGATLMLGACMKLAVIGGILSDDFIGRIISVIEPYFAPCLILLIGSILIYIGLRNNNE